MADEGSAAGGSGPPQQGGGPPPEKRLPTVVTKGPEASASAHGPQEESDPEKGTETAKAEAKASGDLGSATVQGSAGKVTARAGYADADASASATGSQVDGASAQVGGEVDAGLARVDGETAKDGLLRGSGGGSVGSVDAHAKGTAKLTREEATLSGKLGASAMVGEIHGKAEIVLTPQRVANGIVVNGVNAVSEWLGYDYRMQKIKNGWLDHGIVLGVEGGLGFGAEAKAEAGATYKRGEGGSVSAKAGVALGPGASLGGKVGFQ